MKITNVESTVLIVPNYNAEACDSAQDTIVVKVHTDEGITGIGEVDTNRWVVKTFIEAPGSHIMALGLRDLLIGHDPAALAEFSDAARERYMPVRTVAS